MSYTDRALYCLKLLIELIHEAKSNVVKVIPVSYTHLDVYKRQ